MAVSPCSYDKWQAVVAGVFVTGALYRLAPGLMSNWAVPILSLELSILLVRDCCSVGFSIIYASDYRTYIDVRSNAQELLAFLGGIVVPFILFAAGFWFAGYDIGLYMERTLKELTLRNVTFGLQTFSLTQWVSLMVFVLLLLLSVIVRGIRRDSSGSLNKPVFTMPCFVSSFTAAGLFIWPGHAQGFTVLFLIPASYFITSLFSETRLLDAKCGWHSLFLHLWFICDKSGCSPVRVLRKATILSFSCQ